MWVINCSSICLIISIIYAGCLDYHVNRGTCQATAGRSQRLVNREDQIQQLSNHHMWECQRNTEQRRKVSHNYFLFFKVVSFRKALKQEALWRQKEFFCVCSDKPQRGGSLQVAQTGDSLVSTHSSRVKKNPLLCHHTIKEPSFGHTCSLWCDPAHYSKGKKLAFLQTIPLPVFVSMRLPISFSLHFVRPSK